MNRAFLSFLKNRPVTVLGSAPRPILPVDWQNQPLICVNGSGCILPEEVTPDLTLMVGCTTRGTKGKSSLTLARLHGRSTRKLLFIPVCEEFNEGLEHLHSAGFNWTEADVFTIEEDRSNIYSEFFGRPISGTGNKVPSNGILALLLALRFGAGKIFAAGIDFRGGHSYLTDYTPRHHLAMDQLAILCFHQLGLLAPNGGITFDRDLISRALPKWG